MTETERISERILNEAVLLGATDVHLIPSPDRALIQFRVDDRLLERGTIRIPLCERIGAHFKFLAGMDIGERRKAQSGSLQMKVRGLTVNLRISTLPTLYQESLVIRILPMEKVKPLERLSLFQSHARLLASLMLASNGLIILTGPTGSGKSTTLYSMLEEAKRLKRKIITLEDPIERKSEGFLQVQINEKAGMNYNSGLKAVLRHDPDVIMVGEIRDDLTAQAAVRASLTGHLVLTSMHTKNAKGALYRLRDLGVSVQDLKQSLTAVVAQRLVELTCPFCKGSCSHLCFAYSNRQRRLAVFELLTGEALQSAFQELLGSPGLVPFHSMKVVVNKAIALGWCPPEQYDRIPGEYGNG